jgi:uncharacterized membrane protein
VPADRPRTRRVYIDWARGLAVLLMIEWHTADAWTRAADRGSAAFGRVLILGGFAAPLFLWLAGLGVALSAARITENEDRRAAMLTIVRRGLEIFILAFLFRLQAFIISPGSYLVTIFRVDILNVMGPAIVLTGLIWAFGGRHRSLVLCAAYSVAAAAIALVTPAIRVAPFVDLLPEGLQWYVRPKGDLTNFTMFPWAGFVFAGAACGVLLAATRQMRTERRLQTAFAICGVALVALGQYLSTQPTIYRDSSFWTTSPTWFVMRVGILMIGVAAIYALGEMAMRWNITVPALERIGRSSLFIYWIHVELVYGYATWLLRGRLPVWGSILACLVFSALMYGAVVVRDRMLENRTSARSRRSTPQAAPA